MKVLIVEDDTSSRILLKKILDRAGHEVTMANNGKMAFDIIKDTQFDAVLTDWMMPEMDGLELINKIRSITNPSPVIIMITAIASRDAFNKAIETGADEFITKPYDNDNILKVLVNSVNRRKSELTYNFDSQVKKIKKPDFKALAIAASTGGPITLTKFFKNLKPIKNAAIFIVLHGPTWMLKVYPNKIMECIDMPVILGEDNIKVEAGKIYLAPGDFHMTINPENLTIKLLDTPPENFVKPSADPLFRTIAKTFAEKATAIVFTGMGHDGSIGSGYIKAAGGKVIAQDPSTAVMPSMPKAIIELKVADEIVKLDDMASRINEILNS